MVGEPWQAGDVRKQRKTAGYDIGGMANRSLSVLRDDH